jgi:serine/threonine protein kinase
MMQQRTGPRVIEVRCPNEACGRTSHLGVDGLRRVFRCPGCRTKLPSIYSQHPAPDGEARAIAATGMVPHLRTAPTFDGDDELADPVEGADPGPLPRLGRLQLREKLGTGSFATIYHAFDPLLERQVVLKVFHDGDRKSPQDRDHFVTEVKALARLRHPQIVPIYDAGCEGAYHYIAMAFIEGRTLAEAISDRPLDFEHAARIVAAIAEALDYAHGMGIVHRDVKPSNIVLGSVGVAHLIDFGLAHRPEKEADGGRAGTIRGTPAYLAPEQGRGDDAIPQPSNDQYSLGAVLYELLCGRPPFVGPPLAVLISALQHEPPPPRTLNPDVPPVLEAVCLKTLAKRPEDRYPSCRELAEDLQGWLRGEPSAADHPPLRDRAWRWFGQVRESAAAFLM